MASLCADLSECYLAGMVPSWQVKEERQRVAQQVFETCQDFNPDLPLILSPNDSHGEHAIVGAESEAVLRGRVPHVWRCLFPWNCCKGDNPNLYVRLEEGDIAVKAAVIDCYQSQRFRYNYRDMLLSYALADGLSVKVLAAEKFEIVRSVL